LEDGQISLIANLAWDVLDMDTAILSVIKFAALEPLSDTI
jgi:hypothetical protein